METAILVVVAANFLLLLALLWLKVEEKTTVRDIWRMTKGYAEVASHRDDHVTRTVSEIPAAVKSAVGEVVKAVSDASDSGTKLRVVPPESPGG